MHANPTLWLVDDDVDDLAFAQLAFGASQPALTLLVVSDPTTLIPLLERCPELPRLVLLDLNMPRKNGFDILAELRQEPRFKQLPVVVFTTSASRTDRDRCLALGADDFLTKPFQYEKLSQLASDLCAQWNLLPPLV
jgi:CheY-like chemotaxis protein